MNCKPIKDEGCESCKDKMLCRTFLELKPLNEYSDEEPIKYEKNMRWDIETDIIATAKRNPILGIEIDTNVIWSTIPREKREIINNWARTEAIKKLRDDSDWVGVTRTFEGKGI